MHSDLRESMKPPTSAALITASLSKSPSKFPMGRYLCQISDAQDIATPAASRHLREASTRGRVFKLRLHCGSMELNAIELEQLKDLPNDIDIGIKVIIEESPIIHEGILMLRPENVAIVGGEVAGLNQALKDLIIEKRKYSDPLQYHPRSRGITS